MKAQTDMRARALGKLVGYTLSDPGHRISIPVVCVGGFELDSPPCSWDHPRVRGRGPG